MAERNNNIVNDNHLHTAVSLKIWTWTKNIFCEKEHTTKAKIVNEPALYCTKETG